MRTASAMKASARVLGIVRPECARTNAINNDIEGQAKLPVSRIRWVEPRQNLLNPGDQGCLHVRRQSRVVDDSQPQLVQLLSCALDVNSLPPPFPSVVQPAIRPRLCPHLLVIALPVENQRDRRNDRLRHVHDETLTITGDVVARSIFNAAPQMRAEQRRRDAWLGRAVADA